MTTLRGFFVGLLTNYGWNCVREFDGSVWKNKRKDV